VDDGGPRYADCPSTESEIMIDAPVSVVWELVTDINLPARFSNEFKGAEWLTPATHAEVGARFEGTNEHPALGRWQTTCTVIECEPGVSFAYVNGEVDSPMATWRFLMAPAGQHVRLVQSAQMGPARSGLSIAIDAMPDKEQRIIARRLKEFRTNMAATLAGVKALAEAAAGESERKG
jgi:Polyketide cyclase / dehydrase and lipid transport